MVVESSPLRLSNRFQIQLMKAMKMALFTLEHIVQHSFWLNDLSEKSRDCICFLWIKIDYDVYQYYSKL